MDDIHEKFDFLNYKYSTLILFAGIVTEMQQVAFLWTTAYMLLNLHESSKSLKFYYQLMSMQNHNVLHNIAVQHLFGQRVVYLFSEVEVLRKKTSCNHLQTLIYSSQIPRRSIFMPCKMWLASDNKLLTIRKGSGQVIMRNKISQEKREVDIILCDEFQVLQWLLELQFQFPA